jgi:hypothetical protein
MSYNTFIASAIDHTKVLTKENIEAAFKLFDPQQTGEINLTGIVLPKIRKTPYASAVVGSRVHGISLAKDSKV